MAEPRRKKICPFCISFLEETQTSAAECDMEEDLDSFEYCDSYEAKYSEDYERNEEMD